MILTFILGTGTAYLVSFYKFPGSNFFKWALILSFAVPPYIYAYSLTAFFENYGTLFSILKSIFGDGEYNKFIPKDYYWDVLQWYFFQVSQVGPYLGQAHQFLSYHAGKSPYAEEKYKAYVKRVYNTLDERLKKNQYLGIEYSIADIATWPWVARFEIHKTNLEDYPNVLRWYRLIAKRSAVIRGFNAVGEKISIPMI